MIDTIRLFLPLERAGVSSVDDVLCKLDNVKEIYEDGGIGYVGLLGNLKIFMNNNRLLIQGFSLPKWWHGDNFRAMSLDECNQAVAELSDALHVPINKADVTRADFGFSVVSDYFPKDYFFQMGILNRYKRKMLFPLREENGIYYKNNVNSKGVYTWELAAYDKIRESKSKGGVIPLEYKDANVIRLETRYKSSQALKTLLGLNTVTPKELFTLKATNKIKYDMEAAINGIRADKYTAEMPKDDPLRFTNPDLFNLIVAIDKFGGEANYVKDLKSRFEVVKNNMNPKQIERLKKAYQRNRLEVAKAMEIKRGWQHRDGDELAELKAKAAKFLSEYE